MRRLNSENVQPPGGFRYFVGETATWVPTQRDPFTNIIDLMEAVHSHHKANRLPLPPNLRELIEDQICSRLQDPAWCNQDGHVLTDVQVHAARSKGWFEFNLPRVRSFSSTMIDWWIHAGRQPVSDEVITARAETCLRCPMHSDPVGCTQCNKGSLLSIVERMISGRKHPLDSKLKSCAACGCLLAIKTRIPQPILLKFMDAEVIRRLHPTCWLHKPDPLLPVNPLEPVLEEAAT
jgi:hypothetical protein